MILDDPKKGIDGIPINFSDLTITTTGQDASISPGPQPSTTNPNLKSGKNDDAIIKKYGAIGDQTQLTTMKFPYPMYYDGKLVTSTTVHKLVKDDLESIFNEILSTYGTEQIKKLGLDQYSGAYNVRFKRGGSTPSIHSWGIAIDIYAAKNDLHQLTNSFPPPVFSQKEYKAFIDIWYKHNFKSFGKELGYDWMHFQVSDAHF
jgi:hypothetical protein